MAKLKSLLEDVLKETTRNKRHEVIESVRSYGGLGSGLYKNNVLEVASKLGEKKHQEVADGIDDLAVHADNYAVTLKSLERRAKQNESS